MQWDAAAGAGFTDGSAMASDRARLRARERARRSATIRSRCSSLYRRLIALRRGEPALEVGTLRSVSGGHTTCSPTSAAAREGEASFLVALNLGSRPQVLMRPRGSPQVCVEVGTDHRRESEHIDSDIALGPDEGLVLRLYEPTFVLYGLE